MENLKKYERVIIEYLEHYVQSKYANDTSGVETQILIDKENHHYMLFRVGWAYNERFVQSHRMHFDIKNGKVWIQVNQTDDFPEFELVRRGIAKSDIVLGFQPENWRGSFGFATA